MIGAIARAEVVVVNVDAECKEKGTNILAGCTNVGEGGTASKDVVAEGGSGHRYRPRSAPLLGLRWLSSISTLGVKRKGQTYLLVHWRWVTQPVVPLSSKDVGLRAGMGIVIDDDQRRR